MCYTRPMGGWVVMLLLVATVCMEYVLRRDHPHLLARLAFLRFGAPREVELADTDDEAEGATYRTEALTSGLPPPLPRRAIKRKDCTIAPTKLPTTSLLWVRKSALYARVDLTSAGRRNVYRLDARLGLEPGVVLWAVLVSALVATGMASRWLLLVPAAFAWSAYRGWSVIERRIDWAWTTLEKKLVAARVDDPESP